MTSSWNKALAMLVVALVVLSLPLSSAQPASAASSVSPDGWGHNTPSQTSTLEDVWGSSPTNVFAVGGGILSWTVLHYDGNSWGAEDLPNAVIAPRLTGVWGSSSSDVFAVGNSGTILHYNGTSWASMTSGTLRNIQGVCGTSSSDVYAVGDTGTILHYNGTSWASMTSGTSSNLYDVWASSSGDVFIVGAKGTILHRPSVTNPQKWDQLDAGNANLQSVWGSSPSDVYAVGNSGTILHYNGARWTQTTPKPTTRQLNAVWGRSSSDVYAVGDTGTILHYNGTNWASMNSGMTTSLLGVWCNISSNDAYAVGASGNILHYPSPTATSVTPAQGSQGQTLDVMIDGTCLSGVSEISFGEGITVSNPALSQTQIRATLAIGATVTTGPRDVTVSASGDRYVLAHAFNVVPGPTVTSVSPNQATQGQTLTVAINGTNFTGAPTIAFGDGIAVSNSSVTSPTQLTATISISTIATPGLRDVSVTISGSPATLRGGFTVTQAPPTTTPTITAVTPNQGSQGQTLDVTITGTNLEGATKLSFGVGIAVNTLTVNGPTQITVNITIEALAITGSRDVSITTPPGGTLASGFTVVQAAQTSEQGLQQEDTGGTGAHTGNSATPLWIWVVAGVAVAHLIAVVIIVAIKGRPTEE